MTASDRDRIFWEVPFESGTLALLHAVALHERVEPVRMLRRIIVEYIADRTSDLGNVPAVPPPHQPVYRGVPLTHAFVHALSIAAAARGLENGEYRLRPLEILRRVMETEVHRRAESP